VTHGCEGRFLSHPLRLLTYVASTLTEALRLAVGCDTERNYVRFRREARKCARDALGFAESQDRRGSLRQSWRCWRSRSSRPPAPATLCTSCDFGHPTPPVTLEDVSHGLAAYIDAGRVHLLQLGDGADRVVGDGTLARFTAAGLAYADGARVRLEPYNRLPS
jgi:hypothetical protein